MTYALAWTPFAFVVFIATLPLWKRVWTVLSGLVEWEGPGGKLTIGGTTAIATIGAFGALYFVGGGAVVVSGGGPSARGTPAAPGQVPNTPTLVAMTFTSTGDSLKLLGSAFSDADGDSQDSLHVQVDTLGGDWTSPQYANVRDVGKTTDTIAAIDSGSVVQARFRYGDKDGWSSWSDSVVVFMHKSLFSDWSSVGSATTIDTTQGAWSDGGVWPNQGNPGFSAVQARAGVLNVDSAGVLNPPAGMLNMIRYGYHGTHEGSAGGSSVRQNSNNNTLNEWMRPPVGWLIYHRFYLAHRIHNQTVDTMGYSSHHPYQPFNADTSVHDATACAFDWEMRFGSNLPDSVFLWNIHHSRASDNAGVDYFVYDIPKDTVHLFEFALVRDSADHYRNLGVRLNGVTLTDSAGIDTTLALNLSDICIQALYIGNNDPQTDWREAGGASLTSGPFPDEDFIYWGGVGIKVSPLRNDWVGPYIAGEGDSN